ncbi:MAG: hypothetical protein ACYDCH_08915 [Gaiellaceae bacterium]
MIPTLLVIGLAVGRWRAVPIAAVGWAGLLLVTGVSGVSSIGAALALGAANTAVAVAVRKTVAWPLHHRRYARGR